MKFKTLVMAAAFLGLLLNQAYAYQTYFGEDLNSSSSTPLASFPNATNAENQFKSALIGVGTETFEGFPAGTTQPLPLIFPGAGTATLGGSSGRVVSVTPGSTNGFGRYAISGSNYWEVSAGEEGDFSVTFSSPVAAFGFYGIDIGDFGGQIQLQLSNGDIFTIPNTIGSGGSSDGTVLFYGLIGLNASETFDQIDFLTSTGQGDVFAFDNLTIGSLEQVVVGTVPEPSTFILVGAGLLGAGLLRRKSRK